MIKKIAIFCTFPLLSMTATENNIPPNTSVVNISTQDLRLAANLAQSVEHIINSLPSQEVFIRSAQTLGVIGVGATLASASALAFYKTCTNEYLTEKDRSFYRRVSAVGLAAGMALVVKGPDLVARFNR